MGVLIYSASTGDFTSTSDLAAFIVFIIFNILFFGSIIFAAICCIKNPVNNKQVSHMNKNIENQPTLSSNKEGF